MYIENTFPSLWRSHLSPVYGHSPALRHISAVTSIYVRILTCISGGLCCFSVLKVFITYSWQPSPYVFPATGSYCGCFSWVVTGARSQHSISCLPFFFAQLNVVPSDRQMCETCDKFSFRWKEKHTSAIFRFRCKITEPFSCQILTSNCLIYAARGSDVLFTFLCSGLLNLM